MRAPLKDLRWPRLVYHCAYRIAFPYEGIFLNMVPFPEAGSKTFRIAASGNTFDFHYDPEYRDGQIDYMMVHFAEHIFQDHIARRGGRIAPIFDDASCIEAVNTWAAQFEKDDLKNLIDGLGPPPGVDLRGQHPGLHNVESPGGVELPPTAEIVYQQIFSDYDLRRVHLWAPPRQQPGQGQEGQPQPGQGQGQQQPGQGQGQQQPGQGQGQEQPGQGQGQQQPGQGQGQQQPGQGQGQQQPGQGQGQQQPGQGQGQQQPGQGQGQQQPGQGQGQQQPGQGQGQQQPGQGQGQQQPGQGQGQQQPGQGQMSGGGAQADPRVSGSPCRIDMSDFNIGADGMELLRQMVEKNLADSPPGSFPGNAGLRSDVKKARKPPWQNRLHSELRGMMPDDYSWRMPRDYGYMGGGLVPTMDGGNPKVLIVVDGSGSMDVGLTDQAFEICKGSVGHGQEPLIAVGDTNLSYPTGSKPGRWAEVQRLLRSEDGLQNVGGGTEMGRVAWEAYDRLVERPEVVVIMTDGGTYWPSKDRPVMVNGRPRTRLPDNTIVCVIGRSEGQMISAMPREIRRHAIFVKRDEELGRSL